MAKRCFLSSVRGWWYRVVRSVMLALGLTAQQNGPPTSTSLDGTHEVLLSWLRGVIAKPEHCLPKTQGRQSQMVPLVATALKKLRANTSGASNDGDNDDGGTGNRRSNDGGSNDGDGSTHSDDSSDDDD